MRDQHGNLTLSKAAKDFHPGRGVYRSSYKNALRLAITETNMAYRLADWERWQQMDFVVGIRIQLSNNHTCLGKDGNPHPFHDICDELAGEYPKSFKWVGWHPQCRYNAVPILKTVDEKIADNLAKRNGQAPNKKSVNSVKRLPKAFNEWLKDNMSRAERSFSIPYFIKDNPQFLPKNYIDLYSMRMPYDTYEEYTKAMMYNRKNEDISNAQRKNINELNKVLPVVRGKIMDFKEADEGRVNPKFNTEDADKLGYRHNCQTCTVTYELRRRGFDIEAMPTPKGGLEFWEWRSKQGLGLDDIFLDTAGKPVKFIYKSGLSNKVLRSQFIEEQTTTVGRYEVYCEWKPDKSGKRGAHVFIVERQKNGNLLWFDPQSGEVAEQFRTRYLSNMAGYKLGVRRIDDKLVNPKMASRFIRKASQ